MKKNDSSSTGIRGLDNLVDAMVEDILNMTDEEVENEVRKEGRDPDVIVMEMREAVQRAIKEAEERKRLRQVN